MLQIPATSLVHLVLGFIAGTRFWKAYRAFTKGTIFSFRCSFLVADQVYVASIAAKTSQNPNPSQWVFSSSAEESSFEVYPDPRGNTLGRGTEITLVLKPDSLEYLDTKSVETLVYELPLLLTSPRVSNKMTRNKHSVFSSAFPIYLFTQRTEQVPDEDSSAKIEEIAEDAGAGTSQSATADPTDNDEVIVEDVAEESEKLPKLKSVTIDEWRHLNSQPPLWMRYIRCILLPGCLILMDLH